MSQLGLFGGANPNASNNNNNGSGNKSGGGGDKRGSASSLAEARGVELQSSNTAHSFASYLGTEGSELLPSLLDAAKATMPVLSDVDKPIGEESLDSGDTLRQRLGLGGAIRVENRVRTVRRVAWSDNGSTSQVFDVSVQRGVAFGFLPYGGDEVQNDEVLEARDSQEVESLIARMGAKSRLRSYLCSIFPQHNTYVEPFAGSFKVVLWKPRSKIEIVNDIDADVVHFFKYVRYNHEALVNMINEMPTHEALCYAFREELKSGQLTGLERAVAFWFASQSAFNSAGTYHSYASSPSVKLDLSANMQKFKRVADRLIGVDIRARPYKEVIEYANKQVAGGVFFYLDPPYWGTFGYKSGFDWQDQLTLAEECAKITAMGNKLIQTNSDHKDLIDLYGRYKNADGSPMFYIKRVDVKYTFAGDSDNRRDHGEFIISNFKINDKPKSGGLFG